MANLETGSAQPSLGAAVDHAQQRGSKRGRAVRSVLIFLLVIVLALSALPLRAMAFMTWTVDDDFMPCTTANFTSINAAVTAALPGDMIVVCDGTYVEQVTIGKTLTVQGFAGQVPTVKAPAVMLDKALIHITGPGAMNVIIDSLVISGPGGDICDSIQYGIRVDGGASATITRNLITDIHDTPFGGCQNGIGIGVGRQADATTGMATINDNILQGYQKGGIVVDNFGSSAVITNNVVTGVGRTEIIAQNGVQVSRGAVVPPSNLQNNTITGNFYLNRSPSTTPAFATGILYFQAGDASFAGPLNSGNKLRHNQVNVSIIP
jgi:hypothetical protein